LIKSYLITIFNFNSSKLGTDKSGSLTLSIEDESEVKFSLDVNSFVNKDGIDLESLLGGLVGDEVVTDHLLGEFPNFFRSVDQLDAAFESAGEMAFSTAAGVHLGLG
jgi:hypothetical protein